MVRQLSPAPVLDLCSASRRGDLAGQRHGDLAGEFSVQFEFRSGIDADRSDCATGSQSQRLPPCTDLPVRLLGGRGDGMPSLRVAVHLAAATTRLQTRWRIRPWRRCARRTRINALAERSCSPSFPPTQFLAFLQRTLERFQPLIQRLGERVAWQCARRLPPMVTQRGAYGLDGRNREGLRADLHAQCLQGRTQCPTARPRQAQQASPPPWHASGQVSVRKARRSSGRWALPEPQASVRWCVDARLQARHARYPVASPERYWHRSWL